MSNVGLSLHRVLGLDVLPLDASCMDAVTSDGVSERLRVHAQDKAGAAWSVIRRRVPEQLERLLDIDAVDVLVGAWNKSRELRKYRDSSRYPPEQVVIAPLTKHRVQSKHEPYLEITVDGQRVGQLRFQVDLDATLEGVELKIQGGRVKEIAIGTCTGKATIRCEGALVGGGERKVRLPARIDLKDGIAIPD